MAESTLTLDQYDLEAEVGDFAGYGRGARFGYPAWTAEQQGDATLCVKSGLRMVYFTMEMEGVPGGYAWSFLKPTSRLTLAEGEDAIRMPNDFGGLEGEVIPVSTDGEAFGYTVPVAGPGRLHAARAACPDATGHPQVAVLEVTKGPPPSRYELKFWPIADRDYVLSVRYYLVPNATSAALPHVYGGAAHAETFKAAVRAAYEQDFNNTRGVEWARFAERLRASIAYDRKLKPVRIGPNLDRSDGLPVLADWHNRWGVGFSVNGVSPG